MLNIEGLESYEFINQLTGLFKMSIMSMIRFILHRENELPFIDHLKGENSSYLFLTYLLPLNNQLAFLRPPVGPYQEKGPSEREE